MRIYPEVMTHPKDKTSTDELNQNFLFRILWKIYSEKLMNDKDITAYVKANTIRLSEDTLPEVYNCLPTMCKYLNVEVPELYISEWDDLTTILAAERNYIVLSAFVFDRIEQDMSFILIGREVAHICCEHVKIRSLVNLILKVVNNSSNPVLAMLCKTATKLMENSMANGELSADRMISIYVDDVNRLYEFIYRMNGYNLNEMGENNIPLFLAQSEETMKLLEDYKGARKLRALGLSDPCQPSVVERVMELKKWVESEEYKKMRNLVLNPDAATEFPLPDSNKSAKGKLSETLLTRLRESGFTNVKVTEESSWWSGNAGKVKKMTVNGQEEFETGSWFAPDVPIEVTVYTKK